MTYYIRLPYTNAWRAGLTRRDCLRCTLPAASGANAAAIADTLEAQGKLVFGWDTEWAIDWARNRFQYGGRDFFYRLAKDPALANSRKVVVLSHDLAHREWEARDEGKQLEEFIRLAKAAGYKFDTIENYIEYSDDDR